MDNKSKFTILLVIASLATTSLLTVQAYTVDSITKPSVPEFTVKVVAHPYDVPSKTTTTIDQYTGKETTITQPGYHVENKSIEITIKNQPFTPYKFTALTGYNHDTGESYSYVRNVSVNFYYNIQVKGHFGNENDWKSVGSGGFLPGEGPQSNAQLNSKYTVISIKPDYPNDAKLDFRVQALIGYYVAYGRSAVIFGYDFYGQESDWSLRTISLSDTEISGSISPNPTSTPTNSLTPTPTVPEFSSWTILLLLTLMLAVTGLLVYHKKQNNQIA